MTNSLNIPESAMEALNAYKELNLGSKKVQCPYFINSKRARDLRAMVGKGTAEEIIMEAKIWEKLKGSSFEQMSGSDIKQFLIDRGLGIDCSGFAVHVLDAWYTSKKNKHIWSSLKNAGSGVMSKLRYYLRPVENLGANTLTGSLNAFPISINEVKPGDVIRSKWKKVGTHHIQLITRVEYETESRIENRESGQSESSRIPHPVSPVSLIEYTHATPYYGETSGVRVGQIRITDSTKPLYDQEWLEKDDHGVNFSYEGFMTQVEDNGLRRLFAMKDII
jgi:hypothetical protein